MKYLDTRTLYKRQQELQSELDDLKEAVEDAEEAYVDAASEYERRIPEDQDVLECILEDRENELGSAKLELKEWQEEYQEELDALNDLEREVGDEFMHGETLIPEGEFKNYAEDLAADLHGRAIRDASWPFDCIDWEQAADELKMDYSSLEYEGETYWFRS